MIKHTEDSYYKRGLTENIQNIMICNIKFLTLMLSLKSDRRVGFLLYKSLYLYCEISKLASNLLLIDEFVRP